MKITEIINYLEDCLSIYGDCDVLKLNNITSELDSIDEILFIGGNRILMKSNNIYENNNYSWYKTIENIKNEKRKKKSGTRIVKNMNKKFTSESTDTGIYYYRDGIRIFPREFWDIINEQQMIIEKLKKKDLYNNIVFRNSNDMKRFQDVLMISKLLIDFAEEENDKDIAYESLWQLTRRLSKLNDDEYWLDKNE